MFILDQECLGLIIHVSGGRVTETLASIYFNDIVNPALLIKSMSAFQLVSSVLLIVIGLLDIIVLVYEWCLLRFVLSSQ